MTTLTAPQTQETAPAARRPTRHRRFTRHSPAGEVVLGYLDTQAARLSFLDLEVRRDEPDAVHQMRVTVRKLRSALQAFPEIVRKPDTAHVRDELKWLGGVLGDARDAEVLADHLRAGLSAMPTELVLGPAQARITVHFAHQEADTRRAVLEALDSQRYRALLNELARLLDRPPLTPAAGEPAGKVLPHAVGHSYRRTRKRMRQAQHAPAGLAREVALHETRKAAKRARYAAEVARPALGQKAGRFAKRIKKVQSVLGDHQDAVLARAEARDIGISAHRAGENAFSFGLLHERAHHQALAAQHEARRAWRQASRPKVTSWLR